MASLCSTVTPTGRNRTNRVPSPTAPSASVVGVHHDDCGLDDPARRPGQIELSAHRHDRVQQQGRLGRSPHHGVEPFLEIAPATRPADDAPPRSGRIPRLRARPRCFRHGPRSAAGSHLHGRNLTARGIRWGRRPARSSVTGRCSGGSSRSRFGRRTEGVRVRATGATALRASLATSPGARGALVGRCVKIRWRTSSPFRHDHAQSPSKIAAKAVLRISMYSLTSRASGPSES